VEGGRWKVEGGRWKDVVLLSGLLSASALPFGKGSALSNPLLHSHGLE